MTFTFDGFASISIDFTLAEFEFGSAAAQNGDIITVNNGEMVRKLETRVKEHRRVHWKSCW